MTDNVVIEATEFQDQERMQKIVRVLILAVARLPEDSDRDAIWGGLEELADELSKPLDHRQFIQH